VLMGFGFCIPGKDNTKIPQVGFVQIDDDVEIGANTTIDRAALGRTWIQRNVKIDNLVQIAIMSLLVKIRPLPPKSAFPEALS